MFAGGLLALRLYLSSAEFIKQASLPARLFVFPRRKKFPRCGAIRPGPGRAGAEEAQSEMACRADSHSGNKHSLSWLKNTLEVMVSLTHSCSVARTQPLSKPVSTAPWTARPPECGAERDPKPDTFIRISILDTENADEEKPL